MREIRPGAIDDARKIKPEIPEFGDDGIPMRDEVAMELSVEPFLAMGNP